MTEMHEQFEHWYSRVDLGDDPDRLTNRWTGIAAVIANVDLGHCGGLIDLFLDRGGPDSDSAREFIQGLMAEADETFPEDGNIAELSLIAEIVLALAMEESKKDEFAGCVANLTSAAFAGGLIPVDSATDLLGRAQSAARIQAVEIRSRSKLSNLSGSTAPKLDLASAVADGDNMGDFNKAREVFERIEEKIGAAIAGSAKIAAKERRILENQLAIQDEEIDLLWWASNQVVSATGDPIISLPDGARALIVGADAANLTNFTPGPVSLPALLEKAGMSRDKHTTISDAINAVDTEWLKAISPETVSQRLPIHFAIAKRLETPDKNAWPAHWASIVRLDNSASLSEIELAHLFYNERLALSAVGDA